MSDAKSMPAPDESASDLNPPRGAAAALPALPPPDELSRRLYEQYTEIAALAGGLAHEIKNPLSTIRLNMELLAEDFAEPTTPRERRALAKIAMVERECQRLEDVLDEFLNFARVRNLKMVATDLNREIDRILEFYQPQAEAAKIEVVRYTDPNLPSVLLDVELFRGALMNLVLNAQQAMPDGGQLVIRTSHDAARVLVDLIDTGCGMDAKTQEQMFKAFYSTKRGGSGLGLPTARKILEGHGGRIRVQSEPGRGTQMTLELPIAQAPRTVGG